jgi:hypothetical protein
MDLRNVLFIGGSIRQGSVQIRCRDIATRLGCDFKLGVKSIREIPDCYSAFVCVKAKFGSHDLQALAKRGKIIWDIIDNIPPKEYISVYLASSTLAKDIFKALGRVEQVPHHYCNLEGLPNPTHLRRPSWIGTQLWLPNFRGFEHDIYLVDGKPRAYVTRAFRQTGIGLNYRGKEGVQKMVQSRIKPVYRKHSKRVANDMSAFHITINSGIKLINCIGYGIPSISDHEPAYGEFGEGCTIYSDIRSCAKWVRALQNDNDLYMHLRKNCLAKASLFHIDAIVKRYRRLLLSL